MPCYQGVPEGEGRALAPPSRVSPPFGGPWGPVSGTGDTAQCVAVRPLTCAGSSLSSKWEDRPPAGVGGCGCVGLGEGRSVHGGRGSMSTRRPRLLVCRVLCTVRCTEHSPSEGPVHRTVHRVRSPTSLVLGGSGVRVGAL